MPRVFLCMPSISLAPVSATFGSSLVENLRRGKAALFLNLRPWGRGVGSRGWSVLQWGQLKSSERAETKKRSQRRTKGEKKGLVRRKRRSWKEEVSSGSCHHSECERRMKARRKFQVKQRETDSSTFLSCWSCTHRDNYFTWQMGT